MMKLSKSRDGMTSAIIKRLPARDLREEYVFAMWLMFLRAPGCETLPGECVDLGEIGQVKEKDWARLTPYSPAKPSR